MTGFKDVSARLSFSYKLITKKLLGNKEDGEESKETIDPS